LRRVQGRVNAWYGPMVSVITGFSIKPAPLSYALTPMLSKKAFHVSMDLIGAILLCPMRAVRQVDDFDIRPPLVCADGQLIAQRPVVLPPQEECRHPYRRLHEAQRDTNQPVATARVSSSSQVPSAWPNISQRVRW
jgi:hypothetical protein